LPVLLQDMWCSGQAKREQLAKKLAKKKQFHASARCPLLLPNTIAIHKPRRVLFHAGDMWCGGQAKREQLAKLWCGKHKSTTQQQQAAPKVQARN
jgi:hypothetical protein